MPASLDEWQRDLANHFDDVTLKKLDLPHEPVTFAFEHGLDEHARKELSDIVQQGVRQRIFKLDHYLCWTTYSSELGYRYSGDEYWHTFKAQTPHWDHRQRGFIKECFKKFAKEYNGAVPKGAWALKFSIICWPITHAILPNDLQRQLAKVLYTIRHNVVMSEVDSPGQLGRLIETHSLGTTTRFQQLASETELIGQIASALLRDDRSGQWIEPNTLIRITSDLNVEEQARSWLRDAKRHVKRTANLKGLSHPGVGRTTGLKHDERLPQPRIRPSLYLRPQQTGAWRLFIDAPNLNPFVRFYPDLQPLIMQASMRLGNNPRRYPARALLHGSQTYLQTDWPSPQLPLLSFDPSNDDLDALTAHTCSLADGPWLFRLGVDGIGREILSRRVSLGGDYIVVQEDNLPILEIGEHIDLGCSGVTGQKFTVDALDAISEQLSALKLQPGRFVFARPCGLVPISWDREGAAEWLSTEQPIIQLDANYAISTYDVSINTGASELTLTAQPSADNTTFLVLPKLPAGMYKLNVIAHPVESKYQAEEGEMEIAIRDVSTNNSTGAALLVTQEPDQVTFDDLFDGNVKINVLGPNSRQVMVTLSLLKNGQSTPLFVTKKKPLQLPISERKFTNYIKTLLGTDKDLAKAFSEADRCEILFDGSDLGSVNKHYDRPFTPLRWGLTRFNDQYSIVLYDDVDDPESIEVCYYDFATPLNEEKLSTEELSQAAEEPAKPGIYIARTQNYLAVSIVPVHSFVALGELQPNFPRLDRNPTSVAVMLRSIDDWSKVDTRGDVFGRYAWRKAIRALIQQLVGLICGKPWIRAECEYERNENLALLSRYVPYGKRGNGWSEKLITAFNDGVFDTPIQNRISCLAEITKEPEYLCEFALQLTSNPTSIPNRDPGLLDFTIKTAMQRSELVRAARLLVLGAAANHEATQDQGPTPYQGWQWN